MHYGGIETWPIFNLLSKLVENIAMSWYAYVDTGAGEPQVYVARLRPAIDWAIYFLATSKKSLVSPSTQSVLMREFLPRSHCVLPGEEAISAGRTHWLLLVAITATSNNRM